MYLLTDTTVFEAIMFHVFSDVMCLENDQFPYTTQPYRSWLTGCHLEPKRMSLGPPSLQGKCMACMSISSNVPLIVQCLGCFFEAKTSNLRKHFDVLDVSRIDEE